MIRQKIFAILIGLSGVNVTPALAQDQPCGANKPIIVNLAEDGDILWDGKPVTFDEAMHRFAVAVKSNPMPSIQIVPDRMAKYDAVAKFLSHAQELGFHCLRFPGFENGR